MFNRDKQVNTSLSSCHPLRSSRIFGNCMFPRKHTFHCLCMRTLGQIHILLKTKNWNRSYSEQVPGTLFCRISLLRVSHRANDPDFLFTTTVNTCHSFLVGWAVIITKKSNSTPIKIIVRTALKCSVFNFRCVYLILASVAISEISECIL